MWIHSKFYYVLVSEGYAVAQLVDALRYKPEGRGFDARWCHYDRGVDSASNRNEYWEYFFGGKGGLCLGLTTLAHCLEIWES